MQRNRGHTDALVLAALLLAVCPNSASSAVAIIANRTTSPIRFTAQPHAPSADQSRASERTNDRLTRRPISLDLVATGQKHEQYLVHPGECVAVTQESMQPLSIRGAMFGAYELRPYGVYFFGPTRGEKIELREIGLQDVPERKGAFAPALIGAQGNLQPSESRADDTKRDKRRTIRVAIFADDEERAVDQIWKRRLQDRVAAASKIFERTCGMRLAVASFGRWDSDDTLTDFDLSLREFERSVKPGDAHVAIGFASQYTITRGRTHLGGTHGPLHSHILLREWSQHVNEPERLELLVHELGHFLGAVHSPESNSVMRSVLGDRQARARAFRIALDPVNALAMSIVGEEIRDRGISSFGELSEPSRARLEGIYVTLAQAMPDDPAARSYLHYVRRQFRVE
jgi:hypothetical protein